MQSAHGLNVNTGKGKVLLMNARNQDSITMNGKPVEEVDVFEYLGAFIFGG